jgi:hypothetical protein
MQKFGQLIELSASAFSQHLNCPVRQVTHPTIDIQFSSLKRRVVAKTDSLHAASNNGMELVQFAEHDCSSFATTPARDCTIIYINEQPGVFVRFASQLSVPSGLGANQTHIFSLIFAFCLPRGYNSELLLSMRSFSVNLDHLSDDTLAQHCQEETAKFRRQQADDTSFCFELLRRALEGGLQSAITHVMRIYDSLVISWVYGFTPFYKTGEDVRYFASGAFYDFFRKCSNEKFKDFSSVAGLLRYLQMCVSTNILMYLRKNRLDLVDLETVISVGEDELQKVEEEAHRAAIWSRIQALLSDEYDRLLVECVYMQEMKPAAISEHHNTIWSTSRDVIVAKQRIHRTLRKDEELRRLFGL